MPWSNSGAARWSCSERGGARARSTSSPRSCSASRVPGPPCWSRRLLSLMRNQIDAGQIGGVRAGRITSDNTDEWGLVVEAIERDEIDLLLVAPERFANRRFRDEVLPLIATHGRPSRDRRGALHLRLGPRLSARLPADHERPRPPPATTFRCCAPPRPRTTASSKTSSINSATTCSCSRGPLDRESLALDVVDLPSPAQRLAWLAETVPKLPGTGIVYTLTVEDARRVTDWLRGHDIDARAYFGDESTRSQGRGRARATAQRVEVRRRYVGARNGLRQAQPRVRRALPGARVGGCVLPTGWPGRARHRASVRHRARGPRGSADPGLVHQHRVPAPRERRAGRRADCRTGRLGEARRHRARRESPARPAHQHAESAGGRGRRRARRAEVATHRHAVGIPAGAHRRGHRAPPRRTSAHARIPRRNDVPHGVPPPRARRSGSRAVR